MMSRETTLKATGCRPSVTNAARASSGVCAMTTSPRQRQSRGLRSAASRYSASAKPKQTYRPISGLNWEAAPERKPAQPRPRASRHAHRRLRDVQASLQLGQLQPLHLARRPLRQLGDEPQIPRRLVAPQGAQAMCAQVFLRAGCTGLHDDTGENLLPVRRIRDADGCGFQHGGMREQRFVDLARRDVLAALDDQFLESAGDEKESVGVTVADVARRKPAIA